MARVLLIDDDAALRDVLSFALEDFGHHVESFGRGEAGLAEFDRVKPDVVVTDLKMPGIDGVEVVRRVRDLDARVPIIVLTAFGSIADAVEVMKLGAYDYLTKPYNRDELKLTIEQAVERRNLLLENQTLRDRLRESHRSVEFVYASPAMDAVLQKIRRVAPSDATVLITGESGTGKEVAARAIHGYSDRWSEPFVAINCAAIPRDLMETELFGHAKGAFTGAVKDKRGKFQQASKGTLLLDEIGDLSIELQAKLLRVIESGQVDAVGAEHSFQTDVRLIAATNANLEELVRAGGFREDLFYRLNVIPIHIPPLRERPDDIPALWDHFVAEYSKGDPVRSTPGLSRALMTLPWPGNIRELANFCQRMVLLRESDLLDEESLRLGSGEASAVEPMRSTEETASAESAPFLGKLPDAGISLPDLEREIIVRALAKHGGNRSHTAEYLSIPRHVLLYRLEKYKIGKEP